MNEDFSPAQYKYLETLIDGGCKFKFRTILFGKHYVWMTDRFGVWFLERIPA